MKITWKTLLALLLREGYRVVAWEGSHIQLVRGEQKVTLPRYAEFHDSMLARISQQMGVEKGELVAMIKA